MNVFGTDFVVNFLANALATLLGALVGIPIALWVDRFLSRRKEEQELFAKAQQEHQRRRVFLKTVLETLQKNFVILEQMESHLEATNTLPALTADLYALEALGSAQYEIIRDPTLNFQIDFLRQYLAFINRLLELGLEHAYKPPAEGAWGLTWIINTLKASIPGLKTLLQKAIDALPST